MKKAIFLLIILECAILAIFGFLDPFHVGVKYMGEGLPLLFSILLSWILVFKIWSLYVALFIIKPPVGDKNSWKSVLFMLLVLNFLLVLGDFCFVQSKDGLYLLVISFVSTSIVFDVWVFWKAWESKKDQLNIGFLQKCKTLFLIELTTLVFSLLIGESVDSSFVTQLLLSTIGISFWMFYKWLGTIKRNKA